MYEKCEDGVDLALIEPVLKKYGNQRGTLIPILQQAQELYGYLPRPVLDVISRRLRLPMSKIYGVATFYSQFYLERRGRHVLKVCDGTACHVKGTPALLHAVRDAYGVEPGQTTEDYELSLEVVHQLFRCRKKLAAGTPERASEVEHQLQGLYQRLCRLDVNAALAEEI